MFSIDQKFIKLFSILFLNYFNFKSKKKNENRKHFVYKKMIPGKGPHMVRGLSAGKQDYIVTSK